ncbi:MAG: 3-deoxy-manno-octulosonate cytidylyltransferase [Bacteroidales bacterium]|nr:3-deoxy-manno-octulosonate cytidylyltransferase [Bacteroidales bacterium]
MKVLGVIPARYGSTRFPGKPLALIGGKTMIRRTCEQALRASLDAVVVATDDVRIVEEVERWRDALEGVGTKGTSGAVERPGGRLRVRMTRADHPSGTDRCREVLDLLEADGETYDAVVNIQGDEPFIDPARIDQVVALLHREDTPLASLAEPLTEASELDNPNVVKVVFDHDGRALYFSRHPLPFVRGVERSRWLEQTPYYRHVGLYGYRASALRAVTALPKGRLEAAESLEQLRWLENGWTVRIAVAVGRPSLGIDTPEDLKALNDKLLTTNNI